MLLRRRMCSLLRHSILAAIVFFVATILLSREFLGVRGLFSAQPLFTPCKSKNMADLPARLDALRPTIEKIMTIGGTPGASFGFLYRGKQIYYAGYGFRDVEKKLSVTEDTIFPVCSLTKAVTAAALGILVDEKKAEWNTLVKEILPGFHPQDEILANCTTITDLLCHRTGLSWGDNLFIGTENNVLISSDNALKYINSQTRLLPFRYQFSYNNIGIDVAGKVIEALSGESYFNFVRKRIIEPLGMDRTSLKTPPSSTDNVALCYNALDDGTSAPIPCLKLGDDWWGVAGTGMRTSMRDLLKLYKAFLTSFNDQFATGKTSTGGSPLRQVTELMSSKIPNDQPSQNEISYAMGWQRVQLPGRMGQIGNNPGLLPDGMPIVGKGVPSQLVVFHQGSGAGALSLVILHPETESAIVVETNALALNDVPDWIGQLVLEEFLEVPASKRNDYVELAKASAAENLKWYPDLIKELKEAQKVGTSPKPLSDYVGTYWDKDNIFKIVVTLEGDTLSWALQGLDSEKFKLTHYEDDTFTWLQPRNELSKRGRWVGSDQGPEFWKAQFKANSEGIIDKLYWVHDNGVPAVEYNKD